MDSRDKVIEGNVNGTSEVQVLEGSRTKDDENAHPERDALKRDRF